MARDIDPEAENVLSLTIDFEPVRLDICADPDLAVDDVRSEVPALSLLDPEPFTDVLVSGLTQFHLFFLSVVNIDILKHLYDIYDIDESNFYRHLYRP